MLTAHDLGDGFGEDGPGEGAGGRARLGQGRVLVQFSAHMSARVESGL